jgi:hypothetical protein
MNRSFGILTILSVVFVLLVGCSRTDQNPVGTQLPDEDWYGDGPFADTLLVEEEMTVELREGTGASPFLLIGADAGLVSRALVKVSLLPAADSVLVSRLELKVHDFIAAERLTISVFLVTNPDWVEAEATWDLASGLETEDPISWGTPGGDYDGSTLIGSAEVTSASIDSTISIELDHSIVNAWIDSTLENSGLILIAESEGISPGVVEFRSRQSMTAEEFLGPQLYIEYTKEEDPDSVVEGRISITEDVTLYRFESDVPGGSLRVGSVPQYRTFIKFDTSRFSSSEFVRRATLLLPVNERHPADRSIVVGVYQITGDWDSEMTPLNFTALDSVEIGEEEEIELQVTNLVWGWVSGTTENYGFSVKATVERGKIGYVDLETSAEGEGRGPRCIIVYTRPPQLAPEPSKRTKSRD